MTTISPGIPANLLFFRQVEPKAIAGEPGYAQIMAEKIAELTAQKAAHSSAALQRSARSELEFVTGPINPAAIATTAQPHAPNPVKPGGPAASLMSTDVSATLLAAQEARGSNNRQPAPATPSYGSDAKDTFMEYAALTPAQRFYKDILKDLGLTEEELANLPPEERAKIEKLIADKMRERTENALTTGLA